MALRILLALESLEHVVGIGIAGLRCRYGGVMRARPGAAQEHYWRLRLRDPRLEVFDEPRVALAARVRVPFDQHRGGNMTDIVPPGLGASVEGFRPRDLLHLP